MTDAGTSAVAQLPEGAEVAAPAAAPSAFIPPMDEWVRDHYVGVPERTAAMIGSITGKRVLDVGCGECLTALGLANAGASEVIGLDVKPMPRSVVDYAVERVERSGFHGAQAASERLQAITYDGVAMPIESDSVDVVFCWGVFEHVPDVKSVLMEMRRVMKPDGIGLVVVYPWYHSVYGSHLSDFTRPFAHLTSSPDELRAEVVDHLDKNPTPLRNLVLNHMWGEYLTLNKYSANRFYEDFVTCGFRSHRWSLGSYEMDLSSARRRQPIRPARLQHQRRVP